MQIGEGAPPAVSNSIIKTITPPPPLPLLPLNSLPSPAATHQPEVPPYVESLFYDLIDHPPPRLHFSTTAGAATSSNP